MRIIYGIHGYGRGHATRAMAILPALRRKHTVLTLAGGDAYDLIAADHPIERIPTYGVSRHGSCATDLTMRGGYPLHPCLRDAPVLSFVDTELERVHEYQSRGLRMGKKYYLRGLRERLIGTHSPRPHPRYVALRSHLRILPDGGVPVCQFNTAQVGNLLKDSLQDVWHGTQANASRKWVDRCPGCWAECEVIPNAIYSGDLILPRTAS